MNYVKGVNMEQVYSFVLGIIQADAHKIVISGPANSNVKYRKVSLSLYGSGYLCEQLTDTQAFHKTVGFDEAAGYIAEVFKEYTRINAWNETTEFSAMMTKNGGLLTGKRACGSHPPPVAEHNRGKNYIIAEQRIVPPLVDMGVITSSGAIVKAMYDKFRQINRFLEIIDDVIKTSNISSLNIIDFGCGKSYLTFIIYYYFTEIKKIPVKMTGIDLKRDVIEFCSALALKYGYDGLSFEAGDISRFECEGRRADMVISLHACDTATDYAIYNAIRLKARFIFAVPCCQHEIAGQISLDAMPVFDNYGIVKERVSSLITDAIRGNLLTACGYKTQLMEFVDLCHTPKNILIRALKTRLPKESSEKALGAVKEACRTFGLNPALYRLLRENGILTD